MKNLCTFLGTLVIALALFGAGAILAGCDDSTVIRDSVKNDIYSPSGVQYKYWNYRVVLIDGCQYIVHDRGIAHKGNCTNSIHMYRAEDPYKSRK